MGAKEFVDEKIASAPVVVFSKTTCGFCDATKRLLAMLGVEVVVIELNLLDNCGELQDYLLKITGARSVGGGKACE